MSALFWGRSTLDLAYLLDNYPNENSKSFASNFLLQPGGPALNAAITFAQHYGNAYLISTIGNSEFGKSVKSLLQEYNIIVFDLAEGCDFELPMSTVIINSNRSTRTIINSPQKNFIPSIDCSKIIEIIQHVKPENILIDGYNLGSCYNALEYAQNNNIDIIFDGGSFKENTNEYLKYVDVAICSQRFQFPGMSLEETIKKLHDSGISNVAFTRDENPIIYSIKGSIDLIDIEKVETADTLGAGDVLHGAFCYYYSNNKDFISSLKSASIDASNSCRKFGTHTWWKNK